jgi:uncharacterized protein
MSLLAPDAAYVKSIQDWQAQRAARLQADDGWLTVAGLFWLKEGENSFGTDAANAIVLPPGSAPARAGVFVFRSGTVTLRAEAGLQVNGNPRNTALLQSDANGASPDLVTLNDLTMFVIKRGNRFAIRLRDRNSPYRREFTGLRYFPIDQKYQVTAKWIARPAPHTISIPNILGEVEQLPNPGTALFTLDGQEFRLEPVLEGDQLFFIFKDRTAGKETYGAGRFLYTALPKDGSLVLDFNKAYNPPCAFTPYATCPLPPKQNQLTVRIPAGELNYASH